EHGDRDGIGRSIDELLGRIKHRTDGGHDDGRVEPHLGGHAKDFRISDRLRHSHGGDSDPSKKVSLEHRSGVASQRADGRNPSVQGFSCPRALPLDVFSLAVGQMVVPLLICQNFPKGLAMLSMAVGQSDWS
ncbi:MAG: hypothetical protein RJB11_506, partial [Planctomycetota bacterium]